MITRMSQSYRKSGRVDTVCAKKSGHWLPMLGLISWLICTVASLGVAGIAHADTLSPAAAISKEGHRVTVQFRVRGTGLSYRSNFQELYSEHSWEHPQAFLVRIPKSVVNQLSKSLSLIHI